MAGSEPLFQDGDPLYLKLNVEYKCWYKMVKKKLAGTEPLNEEAVPHTEKPRWLAVGI